MILQTDSKTPRLWKLLRTLVEYQAESLLIPVGEAVRIRHKGEWRTIKEHPILKSDELHAHIRGCFGENVSARLDQDLSAWVEHAGNTFFLKFFKNNQEGILKVDRLKALPSLQEWPEKAHIWLRTGGLLELTENHLYIAILKYLAQNQDGLVVSLEKELRYPLPSSLALVHQRECGDEALSKLLSEISTLRPFVLGIGNLSLSESDLALIKRVSRNLPCVLWRDEVF